MKKKMISLMLAGAMVMGLLAGCGSKGENSESGKQSEVTEKKEETKKEEKEEEKEEIKDPVTIKIIAIEDFNADRNTSDWERFLVADEFKKVLEDLGIELEIEWVSQEQHGETIKNRLVAGVDVPDLAFTMFGSIEDKQLLDWGNLGLILPVSDLLAKYDADNSISAFCEELIPGSMGANASPTDGKNYWFFGMIDNTCIDAATGKDYLAEGILGLSLREDWVKAVGEEIKLVYTPDELFDILKKIQDEDANGNGEHDEIMSVELTSVWNGIATAYGLNDTTLVGIFEGGEFTNNFFNDNYKDYVAYMQRLYDAGLVIPDMSNTDELIAANRASAYYHYQSWALEKRLNAEDIGQFYQPIILDLDGDITNGFNAAVDPSTSTTGRWFVTSSATEEVQEAIVKLMDWIYSREGAIMSQFGVEGKAYHLDENGNIVWTQVNDDEDTYSLRESGMCFKVLPSVYAMKYVKTIYSEETYAEQPGFIGRKAKFMYDFFQNEIQYVHRYERDAVLALPTEEESTALGELGGTLSAYCSELHADLIMGEKSIDDLEDYKKELLDLGLQEYIDVQNARYKRAH